MDVRIGVIENDYTTSVDIADQATQQWVTDQQYVTQTEINNFSGQVQQNTSDITSIQSSLQTVEQSYVTSDQLNGYASENNGELSLVYCQNERTKSF